MVVGGARGVVERLTEVEFDGQRRGARERSRWVSPEMMWSLPVVLRGSRRSSLGRQ